MIDLNPDQAQRYYQVIERAIHYIVAQRHRQPELDDMAQALGLSPFHLQRIFKQWAGLSPKRFLQFITQSDAKRQLLLGQSVMDVTHGVGLTSTSRLHDLMVTCEAMTPAQIRYQGTGLTITFGFTQTPFGSALIAWTTRGICHMAFESGGHQDVYQALKLEWPNAQLAQDDDQAQQIGAIVFAEAGRALTKHHRHHAQSKIHLHVKGTNFQIQVWKALMQTKPGQVISYGQLAQAVGNPKASRAVGSAMAKNNIAFLIPCHRVIKESGQWGHYRWEPARKMAMLAHESQSEKTVDIG